MTNIYPVHPKDFSYRWQLLSLLSLLFIACASTEQKQTDSMLIKNLITYHVIDSDQQSSMEKYLTGSGTSDSYIINALMSLRTESIGLESDQMQYVSYSFDTTGYTPDARRKATLLVKNYLYGLYKCDVINEAEYQKYLSKIELSRFTDPLQLLNLLQYSVSYREFLNPTRLTAFADSLFMAGIMSRDNCNKLKKEIADGRLTLHYQMLDYTNHGTYFDLSKFPPDPKIYLPKIYEQLSKLLPELAFTDFNFSIEEDKENSSDDHKATNVIVSLKCHGIQYQHKSFISIPSGKEDGYMGYLDEHEFYQIFNKVLIDNKSPYRLHMMPPLHEFFPGNYQYVGILALTQDQRKVLDGRVSLFGMVAAEDFKALSSDEIVHASALFRQVDLISHLTDAQINEAVENARLEHPKDIAELLTYFPSIVYSIDTELGNLENPYEEILKSLSDISHGAFHADHIQDEFNMDKQTSQVSFVSRGKSYSTKVAIDDDWVDPDFFNFVFTIVDEQKLDGTFYTLNSDGQIVNFIFLKKKQFKFLKEKGVKIDEQKR